MIFLKARDIPRLHPLISDKFARDVFWPILWFPDRLYSNSEAMEGVGDLDSFLAQHKAENAMSQSRSLCNGLDTSKSRFCEV